MKQLHEILLAALEVCMIRVARKEKHPESESLSVPETDSYLISAFKSRKKSLIIWAFFSIIENK